MNHHLRAYVIASARALVASIFFMMPTAYGQNETKAPARETAAEESGSTDRPKADADSVHALLERGDVSTLVANIQRTLNSRYSHLLDQPLLVDGYYGPKTTAAVEKFQAYYNSKLGADERELNQLKTNGIVDDRTFMALEPFVPRSPILQWIMGYVNATLKAQIDGGRTVKHVTAFVACIILLLVGAVAFYVANGWVVTGSRFLLSLSSPTWRDNLTEHHFFRRISQIVPALTIYFGSAVFASKSPFEQQYSGGEAGGVQLFRPPDDAVMLPYFDVFEIWYIAVQRFALAYLVIAIIVTGEAFLRACQNVYCEHDEHSANPIKALVQASRLLLYLLGGILFFSSLTGKNPTAIVAGLGAFMAIIMLIFKDSILGLVASVHIITNNLVKIGDWIEMPKYDADGDIVDISLSTVKVQNFDKTVTTIPTHAILSDSFKNWSAMRKAGGRRIKRSIYIDMRTIKVCSAEMIRRFEKVEVLADYIRAKNKELVEYNQDHDVEASVVNSRRLTNIGTFRAYVESYLTSHAKLRKDMTCLIRHLQPTEYGLPLEVYAFTDVTDWGTYEAIQADVFDHLLSILSEFDLRAFQESSDITTVESARSAAFFGVRETEGLVDEGLRDKRPVTNDKVGKSRRREQRS